MSQGILLLVLTLSTIEIRCWGWLQNLLLHPVTLQRNVHQQRPPRILWSSKNPDYFDLDDEDRIPPNANSQGDNDSVSSKRTQEEGGVERDDGFVSMTKKGLTGFQGQFSKALLAGIFVLGIGVGVTVDSAINTNPRSKSDTICVIHKFAHLIMRCGTE